MKNINLTVYYLTLVLIISAISCTKELPFPDAEKKPQMVINGLFSPNSNLRVQISESCHIQELDCDRKDVLDATVSLIDANGHTMANLEHTGNGFYQNSQVQITENSLYQIEVSHASFDPAKASGSSNVPKQIVCNYIGKEEALIDQTATWAFDIEIEDDPNQENYYILEGKIEVLDDHFDEEYFFGIEEEINGYIEPLFAHYTNDVNAENKSISAGFDIVTYPLRSIYLTDANFNGQTYQTRFGIRFDPIYNAFFEEEVSGDIMSEFKAHLSIKSVSKEMYEYYKSLELYRLGQGNIFAEPEQIYSNVNAGLGIFAAYTEVKFETDLPKSEYLVPNNIDIENEGCSAPCTVKFSTDGGSKLNYNWDFGDGNTSTEAKPEHTYTSSGTYQVELSLSIEPGNLSTWSEQVRIN